MTPVSYSLALSIMSIKHENNMLLFKTTNKNGTDNNILNTGRP